MGYDVNAGYSLVYDRKYPSHQFVAAALRQFQNRLRNKGVWVSDFVVNGGIEMQNGRDLTYIRVMRHPELPIAEIVEISYRVGEEILTDYWEAYSAQHGAKTPLNGDQTGFALDQPLERSRRIWTATPVGGDIHHSDFRIRVYSEPVARAVENYRDFARKTHDRFKVAPAIL